MISTPKLSLPVRNFTPISKPIETFGDGTNVNITHLGSIENPEACVMCSG